MPEEGGPPFEDLWFDPELGTECTLAPASDGRLRCMPAAFADFNLYADASCTEPAAPACSDADVLTHYGLGTCGPARTYRAYRRGEPLAGAYRKEGDSCVPSDAAAVSLSRIDDADMVAGEIVIEPSAVDPRLSVRVAISEDGSRLPFRHYWDEELDIACALERVDEDAWPCVPSAPSTIDGGTCGPIVRVSSDSTCAPSEPSQYYVEREYDDTQVCRLVDVRVHRLGAELAPDTAAECRGIRPDQRAFGVEPGPTLARVSGALGPGEGRLRAYPRTLEAARYRDTVLETDCSPFSVDGVMRCLPAPRPAGRGWLALSSSVFGDPSCEQPVGLAPADLACGEWFAEYASSDTCGRQPFVRFHRAVAPVDRAYARLDDGTCVPYEDNPDFPSVAFTLEPYELERFARFERTEL
ncbi:MAG: hypothetical protein AB7S26_22025 [Sandaracinaceae bacterium]